MRNHATPTLSVVTIVVTVEDQMAWTGYVDAQTGKIEYHESCLPIGRVRTVTNVATPSLPFWQCEARSSDPHGPPASTEQTR